MSSTRFSLRSFGYHLKKAIDREPESLPVPEGIPKEMAEKFLRAMKATKMSEIDDLSNEDIVFFIKNGCILGEMIVQDNFLSESLGVQLQKMRSHFTRNRVL